MSGETQLELCLLYHLISSVKLLQQWFLVNSELGLLACSMLPLYFYMNYGTFDKGDVEDPQMFNGLYQLIFTCEN